MSWVEANQRELSRALEAVRDALQHYVQRRAQTSTDSATTRKAPDARAPAAPDTALGTQQPSALSQLVTTFSLSPFERDTLLLCAGIELDASFASLCASAQGDPARPYPTFGMALAALPNAHWSALTPRSPLRHWKLIDVTSGSALTTSALRIDERVLNYLVGVPHADQRLVGMVQPVQSTIDLPRSHRAVAESIAAVWEPSGQPRVTPVVQLCGDSVADKRAIASAACAIVGLSLNATSIDLLPTAPSELQSLARLIEREGALAGSALLLEYDDDHTEPPQIAAATRLIEQMSGVVLIATRERRATGRRNAITVDVKKPTPIEQRALWHVALGDTAARLNGQVAQMVAHFNLSAETIHAASQDALGRLRNGERQRERDASRENVSGEPEDLSGAVWESCRLQARARMDELAQRIEGTPSWDDLVLPGAQRQVLRDIAAHVRHRATVYEQWGFAKKGSRGLGITALFAGASGTGKTMAAEVLSRELGLDVYRIDLSSVVSKYIGETEKNLRRIFDAAEAGGAILLFDEADALFGKRSEVKDSHDRYANIEVSYLLQRMEAYSGLAILTTNLKSALDTAFLRRIRFVVQFPFPDTEQRAEIWQRVFPRETPTDGVRVDRLAQLNIAGGNIRSVALNAAFLAADAQEPVRMSHLLRAARGEYAKLERPLTEAETAGWE